MIQKIKVRTGGGIVTVQADVYEQEAYGRILKFAVHKSTKSKLRETDPKFTVTDLYCGASVGMGPTMTAAKKNAIYICGKCSYKQLKESRKRFGRLNEV